MLRKIIAPFLLFTFFLSGFARTDSLCVALLGDSMTWIGGDDFEKPKGWTHYVGNLPLKMKTFARSGATWTNTRNTTINPEAYSEILDDDNVILNQAIRLLNDSAIGRPDVIIIYAGANDAWFANRRPGIFDLFDIPSEEVTPATQPSLFTTLEGSIYLTCTLLQKNYPEAAIYLVTPAQAGKIPATAIEKVGMTIENAGEKIGVNVVRGDREIPFRHHEESGKNRKHTYDGVHSNEKGARAIAECMAENIFRPEIKKIK